MKFFDAHCDTIGKIWEGVADFAVHDTLHVTLPGLQAAGVRAQVMASWAWTEKYKGREFETGMGKVKAVRRLCDQYPDDLFLALKGAEIVAACETPEPSRSPAPEIRGAPEARSTRTAIIASLEGADPLLGDVDNLALFYNAGVRLITLAWGDNAFLGSGYGSGSGLTAEGADLVAACEDQGVIVDVSHASDQAFSDICKVVTKPFVASHSNCRTLAPCSRNLTDEMIRVLGDRGGVLGISVVPGFLSREFHALERPLSEAFDQAIAAGESVDEAGRRLSAAMSQLPRPPLDLIVDHVRHAIDVGGEDAVGLGADLDGVDVLPAGFEGVADYPRIAELLESAGLTPTQVEKVCYRNLARVFRETLP
jgi:microsomal dipeptidase-like Zn-dependent dipeptidase